MNRKQLVTLVVLVVVLGAAAWFMQSRRESSLAGTNAGMGKKLLGEFPVNDVTHIAIAQGTNSVNLARKSDIWRVAERKDYPANYGQISEFLLKAKDLKVVQTEDVGPSQLSRLELVPGNGSNAPVVVDFKDKSDKSIQSLVLGKKHMRKGGRPSPFGDMGDEGFPDGRYVKLGNSPNVSVISESFASIEPQPASWLNKDFFKVERPKSIAVTYPAATNSWKITRDTESAEWKLADAKADEKLDSGKVGGVSNPFSSPSFNDVAVNGSPADFGLDKPTVVAVSTFDDFTYTVKVGTKTNDNFPLTLTVAGQFPKERTLGKNEKKEDKDKLDKEFKEKLKKNEDKLAQEKQYENWTYLVSSWSVDSLLKNRADLMADKKAETNAPPSSAVAPASAAPASSPTEPVLPGLESATNALAPAGGTDAKTSSSNGPADSAPKQ